MFGLCRLLGIKLMPRMRGISDVSSTAQTSPVRYQHIDALFGDEIDWDMIATHMRRHDPGGAVDPGRAGHAVNAVAEARHYNRKNLLYRAFRELGRVERTLFLLRFISNTATPSRPFAPKPPRSKPTMSFSTGSPSAGRSSRAAIPSSRKSS